MGYKHKRGRGLFATVAIVKGAYVADYCPLWACVWDREGKWGTALERRGAPADILQHFRTYGAYTFGGYRVAPHPDVCAGGSQHPFFIPTERCGFLCNRPDPNERANARLERWVDRAGRHRVAVMAIADIQAGDEILVHYRWKEK